MPDFNRINQVQAERAPTDLSVEAKNDGMSIMATNQTLGRTLMEELSEQEQLPPNTQEMLLSALLRLPPVFTDVFRKKRRLRPVDSDKEAENP